ncbi:MAG: VWA domain-containing protein, partial [Cypionkella sp.]|nr:VWA domain-containing protein [Cypionkella sp.]
MFHFPRLRSLLKSAALIAALASPTLVHAEGRSIIVLDGSGSMWGQIDGKPKLEIAREALAEVLNSIPADTELGLMAYGHREKGSCSDIELIVPPAKGTAQQIAGAAARMQFLGKTPLTEAVRQAAADLRSTEEKATVILITDGIETCEADPCALGTELEKSGVDFTAHVVGFGLTSDEGKQVACLAENTGGKYIVADDLASLTMALQTTVVSAPKPEPEPTPPAALDYNFKPTMVMAAGVAKPDDSTDVAWELHVKNADGTTGERLWTEYNDMKANVDPGDYRLVTEMGSVIVESDVSFTADALTAPEINMNAARIIVHPIGIEGGPILEGAAVRLTASGGINTTQYGDSRFYVPAGEITLTGSIGSAEASETQTLA